MLREQAIELIRGSRLRGHAAAMIASLKDSVRLHREPVDIATMPLGASRLGGPPDLPEGMEWPSWELERRQGIFRQEVIQDVNKLDCLAQIDLADLPGCVPAECPREGMLYVFYESYEQPWDVGPRADGGAVVIFVPAPIGKLVRTPPPPERSEHTPRPCRLGFTAEVTLPFTFEGLADDVEEEEYMENIAHRVNEGEVVHRMFGHPQAIQDEESLFDDSAGEELLLLQLDSDDDVAGSPGWMWGDCGRLYFTITRDALARRDFASVRMTLQCY